MDGPSVGVSGLVHVARQVDRPDAERLWPLHEACEAQLVGVAELRQHRRSGASDPSAIVEVVLVGPSWLNTLGADGKHGNPALRELPGALLDCRLWRSQVDAPFVLDALALVPRLIGDPDRELVVPLEEPFDSDADAALVDQEGGHRVRVPGTAAALGMGLGALPLFVGAPPILQAEWELAPLLGRHSLEPGAAIASDPRRLPLHLDPRPLGVHPPLELGRARVANPVRVHCPRPEHVVAVGEGLLEPERAVGRDPPAAVELDLKAAAPAVRRELHDWALLR
mmetsp:Transcript_6541/g.15722  ORF Transcript_6541/g.15722 Transcript_6541/m.15722 type:complete len:282 (-) Transcript_6541:596-1441(-)